ncbi:MAG: hypothetical protein ACREQ5_14945 [Candidatus Dormibacteria bacterium]
MAGGIAAANVYLAWRIVRGRHGCDVQDGDRHDGDSHSAAVAVHPGQRAAAHRRQGRPDRRRAHARPFVALGIVVRLCLLVAGDWWDPTTWWGDLVGFFHGVEDSVIAFVHLAIATALVPFHNIVNFMAAIYNGAIAAINAALSTLESWGTEALTFTRNAASIVGHWIDDAWNAFYADVIAPALHDLRAVIDFGVGLLVAAVNDVRNGIDWLQNVIVAPLVSWVEHAAETVGGWIKDAWNTVYADVIAPIIAAADAAYHVLDTVWQWVDHYGGDLVHMLEVFGKWLLHFVEDPIGTLEAVGASIGSINPRSWVADAAQTGRPELDALGDYVERLLG